MQTMPTYPTQRGFGDYLRPTASMHGQVPSQGQPILVTSLSFASEAPEVDRRPITPAFEVRVIASLWVWVCVSQ